ncbi:MAG: hypothetical protein ABI387_12025 [Lacunisphaera sp.]
MTLPDFDLVVSYVIVTQSCPINQSINAEITNSYMECGDASPL